MKLLVHKDDLDIDVLYICEMHVSTFMRMLDFDYHTVFLPSKAFGFFSIRLSTKIFLTAKQMLTSPSM